MPICMNCGNSAEEGRKFCSKCGKPMNGAGGAPPVKPGRIEPKETFDSGTMLPPVSGDLGGMEIVDPEKYKRDGRPQVSGLGFTTESLNEAQTRAAEAEKKAKEEARKKAREQKKAEKSAAADISIEELLAETEGRGRGKRRRKPILKNPVFWFSLGTAAIVPGLLMPWVRFYDGESLTAFRLPVVFLFTDRVDMLPQITAGMAVAAILALNLLLTVYPKRIVTFMQLLAFAAVLLTIGVLLLGLRNWNAAVGLGPGYAQYLELRVNHLPADPVPQLQVIKFDTGETPSTQTPAGADATSGFNFFTRTLCPGALFPIVSGLLIIWASMRFGAGLRYIEFQMPATLGAIVVMLGGMFLILFLFARIMPAHWYYLQSEVLMLTGRADAAEKRLELCVDLPVPDHLCKNSLARVYWQSGRVKEARKLLLEVIKRRPDFPEPHRDLAALHYAGKNYWKAAEEYRKYLKLRPGDLAARRKFSEALVYIGSEKYGAGKFKDAVRFYSEALETLDSNRTDTALRYKMGDAYYQMGKLKESLENFQAAADLQPEKFDLQIHVAKVFEEKGDYENAMLYYKKSIEAKEDNSMSYVYIGNLYRDIWGDPAKAADWYQQAIDANPVSYGSDVAREALENLKY